MGEMTAIVLPLTSSARERTWGSRVRRSSNTHNRGNSPPRTGNRRTTAGFDPHGELGLSTVSNGGLLSWVERREDSQSPRGAKI